MLRSFYSSFTYVFCFLILSIGVSSFCYAQTNELQESKDKILSEIRSLNALLQTLEKTKSSTSQRVEILTKKIRSREVLLNVYKKEIKQINTQITTLSDSISGLDDQVNLIKSNFADLLKSMQIQQSNSNNWLFILDAKNLQQAYKRYNYLKQYSDYRKNQVNTLVTKVDVLKKKKEVLDSKRKEKKHLESSQIKENNQLVQDKQDLKVYINGLNDEQDSLLLKINEKKKLAKVIDNRIREAIRKEKELARKKALALANKNKSKNTKEKPVTVFSETPEGKLISKNFKGNKGQLPWPVSQYKIKHKFGPYHPKGLPNITFDVKGLEISTPLNEKVRSVFSGRVSAVFLIPNGTKGIVVRHGSFVTIYSKLKEVNVKEGDFVKVNTILGKVGSEDATFGLLDFQIWIEYKDSEVNLNPELWLRKK